MRGSLSAVAKSSFVLMALCWSTVIAAQEAKQCPSIRAFDGSCADPGLVDAAKKRASVVSSSFSSYIGTPVGTVGLPPIPYERLFRDDVTLFGLPTNTSTFKATIICDAPCTSGTITSFSRSK